MKSLLDWDTPERIDEPELIDDEDQPYPDFRASMTDVQHANRFLGGTPVVARQAKIWLRAAKFDPAFAARPVTFLDVATGSGDLPKAIVTLARRESVPVRIVGLDFRKRSEQSATFGCCAAMRFACPSRIRASTTSSVPWPSTTSGSNRV